MAKVPHILKTLYDSDILDEEVLIEWDTKVSLCIRLIYFHLVGLYYVPHFNFGYSKQKTKKTQWHPNIVQHHSLLDIKSHYV